MHRNRRKQPNLQRDARFHFICHSSGAFESLHPMDCKFSAEKGATGSKKDVSLARAARQAVLILPSVIFGFASDSICQTHPKMTTNTETAMLSSIKQIFYYFCVFACVHWTLFTNDGGRGKRLIGVWREQRGHARATSWPRAKDGIATVCLYLYFCICTFTFSISF